MPLKNRKRKWVVMMSDVSRRGETTAVWTGAMLTFLPSYNSFVFCDMRKGGNKQARHNMSIQCTMWKERRTRGPTIIAIIVVSQL